MNFSLPRVFLDSDFWRAINEGDEGRSGSQRQLGVGSTKLYRDSIACQPSLFVVEKCRSPRIPGHETQEKIASDSPSFIARMRIDDVVVDELADA
jgi:hypothetical protein